MWHAQRVKEDISHHVGILCQVTSTKTILLAYKCTEMYQDTSKELQASSILSKRTVQNIEDTSRHPVLLSNIRTQVFYCLSVFNTADWKSASPLTKWTNSPLNKTFSARSTEMFMLIQTPDSTSTRAWNLVQVNISIAAEEGPVTSLQSGCSMVWECSASAAASWPKRPVSSSRSRLQNILPSSCWWQTLRRKEGGRKSFTSESDQE